MRKMIAVVAACFLLCGCVIGSVNPFYTEDLVIKKPELLGTWYFKQDVEANDESPLVLTDGKMTVYDDKGVPSDVKVTFFMVDDALFIDIFPDEGRLKLDLVKDQAPVHLLSRVVIAEADKMSFNALDYEWLAKEVQSERIQLPYQQVGQDNKDVLFTATSEQWVEFLRRYKDDPQAFPPDGEAPLVRKSSQQ